MRKIKYMLTCVKRLNIKNMFNIINKLSKKTHKNKIILTIDIVYCALRYGAGYYDYQEFEFYNLTNKERKTYLRNLEDNRIDISLLGAVYPFRVFSPKEKRILNTVENINLRLRTYTGGYQRFEYDHYRGGAPWPIANLWMTLYYLESGEKKKAKEAFDFVVKTAGKHYLLGEQVNNETLKPNWVIGLGWSHAMFLIVLEKLYGDK